MAAVNKTLLIAAAAAAGIALLYLSQKGAFGAGQAIGETIGNGAAGVVVGIGETIGIPATDVDRCRQAMTEGNTWDASFYCPATTFLEWAATGRPKPT